MMRVRAYAEDPDPIVLRERRIAPIGEWVGTIAVILLVCAEALAVTGVVSLPADRGSSSPWRWAVSVHSLILLHAAVVSALLPAIAVLPMLHRELRFRTGEQLVLTGCSVHRVSVALLRARLAPWLGLLLLDTLGQVVIAVETDAHLFLWPPLAMAILTVAPWASLAAGVAGLAAFAPKGQYLLESFLDTTYGTVVIAIGALYVYAACGLLPYLLGTPEESLLLGAPVAALLSSLAIAWRAWPRFGERVEAFWCGDSPLLR